MLLATDDDGLADAISCNGESVKVLIHIFDSGGKPLFGICQRNQGLDGDDGAGDGIISGATSWRKTSLLSAGPGPSVFPRLH